jgi:hypothetical protein
MKAAELHADAHEGGASLDVIRFKAGQGVEDKKNKYYSKAGR